MCRAQTHTRPDADTHILTCIRADARRWRLAWSPEGRVVAGGGRCQRKLELAAGDRVVVGSGPRPRTSAAESPPGAGATTMAMCVLSIGCAPLKVLSASVDALFSDTMFVCVCMCMCVHVSLTLRLRPMLAVKRKTVYTTHCEVTSGACYRGGKGPLETPVRKAAQSHGVYKRTPHTHTHTHIHTHPVSLGCHSMYAM